ncbi:MAG TPA: NTP transferase domain-containing protein [Rhodanobacteraceae bacterium]|nr:NTP transferase domain-containing protein [Rhodanobacteraceae bacterium]
MPTGAERILGAVLAGGAGSRVLGADKGLLPLRGRPLVAHALDALRPQCDSLLVVANRNPDRYAEFAPTIHDVGAGHAGPLAGLAAAFGFVAANAHADVSWLATVPVDCPDPPCDLVPRLRVAVNGAVQPGCAYAGVAGQAQPLFALYRIGGAIDDWLASARSALERHGSVVRWHVELGAVAIDFDADAAAFHNLNTPDDFAEYQRAHGGT